MHTKLSVLLPTTGSRLPWLQQTFRSIDEDCEIRVFANGAAPETVDWLTKKTSEDPRVVLEIQDEPMGMRTFAYILNQVREGFVTIIPDDDYFLPGGLRLKRQFLEDNPRLGFVFSRVHTCDAEGNDQGVHTMGAISGSDVPSGAVNWRTNLMNNYVPGCSVMMRAEKMSAVYDCFSDPRVGTYTDVLTWTTATFLGIDAGYVAQPTVMIRQHAGGMECQSYANGAGVLDYLNFLSVWSDRFRPSKNEYLQIQRTVAMLASMSNLDLLPKLRSLENIFDGGVQ